MNDYVLECGHAMLEASDCYGTNERAHRRCIYCAAASAPSFCFAPLTA